MTLVGEDLPGLTCGGSPDFPGYANIHVGVQRRGKPGELLGVTPGDAERATWTLACVAKEGRDGGIEVTGPYVQGGPGGRFVYLSWGTVAEDGTFTMFRRAKLMLGAIAPEVLAEAVRTGRLTGRLGLTDAKGHPTCARVVPPAVEWSAHLAGTAG